MVEVKAGPNEIQVSGTDKGIVNIDELKLIAFGVETSSP
jgi:hypothetical protein